jgi:transcriptional regulator with XRE-family HTH domain
MAFDSRLRELREAAKMTQEQLAKAAGMSLAGIAQLERGRRAKPAFDTIQKLAAALGVGVEAFFAESVSDAPAPGRGRPRKTPAAAKAPKKKG